MNKDLGLILFSLGLFVILWVFHNYRTDLIAQKMGVKETWPVWIPLWGKFYVYSKMANNSGATVLFCLIPYAFVVMLVYWFYRIANRLGNPIWLFFGPITILFVNIDNLKIDEYEKEEEEEQRDWSYFCTNCNIKVDDDDARCSKCKILLAKEGACDKRKINNPQ